MRDRRAAGRLGALLGVALSLNAVAAPPGMGDLMEAAAGHGDGVNVLGVAAGRRDLRAWSLQDAWTVRFGVLGEIEILSSEASGSGNRNLLKLSALPVLRIDRKCLHRDMTVYIEGALGGSLLSHTRLNDERMLSTAFQFDEYLGGGIEWGSRREHGVGVRIRHISNGGIKRPNGGLSYVEVVVRYYFDAP